MATLNDFVNAIKAKLDGKAPVDHDHDDRYYTESEATARANVAARVDFAARPDGSIAALDSGQAVTFFGNAPASVVGGKLVHTPYQGGGGSASYAQANVGAKVTRIGAMVSWEAGSVGALALVLPNTAWSDASKPVAPVHFVMYGNGIWHCSRWNSPGETFYARTEATATDPTKAARFPDSRDGTPRLVQVEVNHDTNEILFSLPGGATHRVVTTTVAEHTGTQAIWEHFENDGTTTGVRIHGMWADGGPRPVGAREVSHGDIARALSRIPLPIRLLPTRRTYRPATTATINAPITTPAEIVAPDATQITRINITFPPSGRVCIKVRAYVSTITARAVFWSIVRTDTGATLDSHRIIDGAGDTHPSARWIEESFDLSGMADGYVMPIAVHHLIGGATASDVTVAVGQNPSRQFEVEVIPLQ